ncbi:hypothetical protein GCM10009798_33980 [Nocardioides panacihumi]|uniref:ChsH2 C-terminal OB-fold domain-containing protein n=1 Tax=Nocardioides panacihumi TaxID=400774 RepID=A0ABN2RJY8_9ACTN
MTTMLTSDWLLADSLAPDVSDDLLAPLYAAGARHELVLPFCGDCSLPLDLDQQVCDGCGAAEIAWRPVEKAGTVHSVTVMHRREPDLVVASDPYPILDVELASGHRLIMTTHARSESVPRVGDRVTVAFRELGGVPIPSATPAAPRHTVPLTTEARS